MLTRIASIAAASLGLVGCGTLGTGSGSPPTAISSPTATPATADSPVGRSACLSWASSQTQESNQLEAEYDSSASGVAAWQEKLAGGSGRGFVSPWRTMSSDTLVYVCYFRGTYKEPVIPPEPGRTPHPLPDTNIVGVSPGGSGQSITLADSATFPIQRPSS